MCGICGIITFDSSPVKQRDLKIMTDTLAHRGPDGEGFWIHKNANVGFGHRRLSIIDLSDGGAQPMNYGEGRYTITFNGEIYNYLELKNELKAKGFQFKTNSDTEVLLALYHHKREKCVDDLDGMFAFAIWDEQEQQLFCARDRFGEKPFFIYHEKNKRLIFASELKAFWAVGVNRKVNDIQLFNFVALKHWFEPYNRTSTFYDNIVKLEAGHFVIINKTGELKNVKYWDIDVNLHDDTISFDEACEKFKILFTDSLIKRMRADVPVGSSLSGGLDSSLIVCLLDEMHKGKPISQNTFSARFRNFEKDEGVYMQKVIEKTNVKPHFVFPDEEMFISEFDKMAYHIEEPFGTASVLAQYAVMQSAKENNVKVLLDGQGADEVLAGYNYMFYHFFLEQARYNSKNFMAEKTAYNTLYNTNYQTGKLFKLYAYAPSLYNKSFQLKQKKELALNNFIDKDFAKSNSHNHFEYNQGVANNLNKNLYYSISSGQLEDLLKYADRNAMANSVEVRLPFLNHKLVEFLFTLPSHYKIHNGWTKYIMRKSFEQVLPKEIAWRKDKIGYETPHLQWMQSNIVKEKIRADIKLLADKKIISPELIESIDYPEKHKNILSKDVFRCWVAAKLVQGELPDKTV